MAEPTVTIEQGTLIGTTRIDHNGNTFYSFQGIPYAKPPIEELRFKAPEPPEAWKGTLDATKEKDSCYSQHFLTLEMIGSEDCLYLNVFTPQISKAGSRALKPVMVYIHTGKFIRGSCAIEYHGPEFLISHDIVLVTFNYRVGCLGFLKLEDTSLEVTGNAGLKDQVMALKWVQKNIQAFMGDPFNVTIFGVSAGGGSAHLQMLSPMAKGLFHRAIVQSSSAIHYWYKGFTNPVYKLAAELGIQYSSERDLLEQLRTTPAEKIVLAQKKTREAFPMDLVRPFGPVIEQPSDKPSFLRDKPINIIRSGVYNHVPLMIGYHQKDGMGEMLYKHKNESEIVPNFEFVIPCDLEVEKGSQEWSNLVSRFKKFYFGEGNDPKRIFDGYTDMFSDSTYIRRVQTTVRNHVITSKCPIFFYVFSFDGKANFHKRARNITFPGSIHADEYSYIFKNFASAYITPGSPEEVMMKRITKLWTNFARYGKPTPEKDALIGVEWKPVTSEKEMNFLSIDEELTMGVNPDWRRMAFWDNILHSHPSTCYL